jgi:hypothetical protein
MSEERPLGDGEEIGPTKLPLRGPNVINTLDVPPRPDAVRAHDAAIRRHLLGRRSERLDDPDA